MATIRTPLILLACIAFVQCQRFQSAPSVVEPDYDYAEVPQRRPVQSQVSTRATAPVSSFRNSIQADTTVKTSTPPVAILKQINRHNEDGSYTYGYEGGDGSFKIETKLPTGEVMGKYGYVDDTGKVRVVEYGANKYGFQPSGEGITVPPPNLVEETTPKSRKGEPVNDVEQYDDFVEEPRPQPVRAPARAPASRPAPSRQQFAVESFQSRQSLAQEPVGQQQNRAPVQFFQDEQIPSFSAPSRPVQSFSAPPPSRPAPSFSAPPPKPSSFSGDFSSFLTSDFPTPPRPAPARVPSFDSSPVPPRPASFAGASPSRPNSFGGAETVPARPASFAGASPAGFGQESFAPQPQFRPSPAQSFFQPSQSFQQPQRPQGSRQTSASSILDQLSIDYALPKGGSRPLHDITFGV